MITIPEFTVSAFQLGLGIGGLVWLLLGIIMARWAYRNTVPHYNASNAPPPSVVALLAFVLLPLALFWWAVSVGNEK